MRKYETIFLARPDLSSNQNEKLVADFTEILEKNNGSVNNVEYAGLRSLAYRIKKNKKAHYTLLNIAAPTEAINEMERHMRLSEDILRYLTVAVEEFQENASAFLTSNKIRENRRYEASGSEENDSMTGEAK